MKLLNCWSMLMRRTTKLDDANCSVIWLQMEGAHQELVKTLYLRHALLSVAYGKNAALPPDRAKSEMWLYHFEVPEVCA